jgi:hypothetical protein
MTLPFDRDQVLKKNPKITPSQLAALEKMLSEMRRAGLDPFRSEYRIDPVLGSVLRVGEQPPAPLVHQIPADHK